MILCIMMTFHSLLKNMMKAIATMKETVSVKTLIAMVGSIRIGAR